MFKIVCFGKHYCMKTASKTVEQIKQEVENLKGKTVDMCVNKGRRKLVKFRAEIVATYPCVFMVETDSPLLTKTMSYSYSEILCGNVRIRP